MLAKYKDKCSNESKANTYFKATTGGKMLCLGPQVVALKAKFHQNTIPKILVSIGVKVLKYHLGPQLVALIGITCIFCRVNKLTCWKSLIRSKTASIPFLAFVRASEYSDLHPIVVIPYCCN